MKGFKAAMMRLMRNKLFMCNFFSNLFFVFAFMGFGTFMPKYMEFQVRIIYVTLINIPMTNYDISIVQDDGVEILVSDRSRRNRLQGSRVVAFWLGHRQVEAQCQVWLSSNM